MGTNMKGFVCFLIVARFLGVEVPKQVEREFDTSNEELSILKSAKSLGMKAKTAAFSKKTIRGISVPMIVETDNSEYMIVLKQGSEGWTILDPTVGSPAVFRITTQTDN